MKTSEFIEKVNDKAGIHAEREENGEIYIYDSTLSVKQSEFFIGIGADLGNISIDSFQTSLENNELKKLYMLAVNYAFTPLNEREDEPRFKVRTAPVGSIQHYYLCKTEYGYHDTIDVENATTFTQESYNQYKSDYPEWRPFLQDYDPDNTDVFVPVEAEK